MGALIQRTNRSRLAPPCRFMSEKGWWEDGDGPEVEDQSQEDEGAVVNLVSFVLRSLAVFIMFYISINLEYL